MIRNAALVGALLYLTLVCFPQIAFAHTVSYKAYHVYTTEPLGDDLPALHAVLDEVDRRLASSEVYDRTAVHRIFLTPSHRWFAFFAPGSRSAFAVNRHVLHHVLVNESDLAANVVRNGSEANGQRALDGVLAHEITHTLLARRFGDLRLLQARAAGRSLREEGYCDFVAQETSFDPEHGAAMLRRGEREQVGLIRVLPVGYGCAATHRGRGLGSRAGAVRGVGHRGRVGAGNPPVVARPPPIRAHTARTPLPRDRARRGAAAGRIPAGPATAQTTGSSSPRGTG